MCMHQKYYASIPTRSMLRCFITVVLYLVINNVCFGALLRKGNPLSWSASKPFLNHIRNSGVKQFIAHYKRCAGLKSEQIMWGDEIENGIYQSDQSGCFDIASKVGTKLLIDFENQQQLIKNKKTNINSERNNILKNELSCEWHPEYGSWMVESVPDRPFSSATEQDLLQVEKSMKLRRQKLYSKLECNQIAPTMTCFPMLGVKGYSHTPLKEKDFGLTIPIPISSSSKNNQVATTEKISESNLVSDDLINPHPRFGALTKNIRKRRGSKVNIILPTDPSPDDPVPVHVDQKHSENADFMTRFLRFFHKIGSTNSKSQSNIAKGENIELDAMAFGMGCCCLQVTMQLHNEDQSRYLHDQLAALSPIFHALSAATPIAHGRLLATDTRWSVISQAVDDRTPAERGTLLPSDGSMERSLPKDKNHDISSPPTTTQRDPFLVGQGVQPLSQSRYSDSPLYISRPQTAEDKAALDLLNDLSVPIDEVSYDRLREAGVDEVLAKHIAHLFVRDPLVVFDDQTDLDDETSLDHFESIQSTNWRSMRWKPPTLQAGFQHQQQQQPQQQQLVNDDINTLNPMSVIAESSSSSSIDSNDITTHAVVASDTSATSTDSTNTNSNSNDMSLSGLSTVQRQLEEPGWRVEFRSLELQLTDFENAAFSIIIVLLSKCILHNRYNFMIPMSYVHENMRRAQLKDAVLTQKFWFRRNFLEESSLNAKNIPSIRPIEASTDLVELSINEIMNGMKDDKEKEMEKEGNSPFPGLLSLIHTYTKNNLSSNNIINTIDDHTNHIVAPSAPPPPTATTATNIIAPTSPVSPSSCVLDDYIELIQHRSSGELPTTARWMRNFITNHPQYIPNSGRISPNLSNDLLRICSNIGMGVQSCAGLYGFSTLKHIQNLSKNIKNKLFDRSMLSDACMDNNTDNNKMKRKNLITSSACSLNKNNYYINKYKT